MVPHSHIFPTGYLSYDLKGLRIYVTDPQQSLNFAISLSSMVGDLIRDKKDISKVVLCIFHRLIIFPLTYVYMYMFKGKCVRLQS